MEARNITVVTTQNQNKYVVNTDATTLRELKSALAAHNIAYEGRLRKYFDYIHKPYNTETERKGEK